MMISTPLRSRILTHTRSSSLPSRSHPLIPHFNDHLQKLKSCEPNNTTSLSSLTKKLHFLDDLHTCVDDLLLLPHTHKIFARENNERWVEEVLDGYLRLVDACAIAKDFVFHTKQFVLDFLSHLRRRDDLCGLFNARKTMKKMIQKSLKNISGFKNKASVLALDKEEETIAVISMLKEAESATIELIESLLVTICGIKGSRWSLVSKLMNSRHDSLEFAELDATLYKLVSFKTSSKCDHNATMQVDHELQVLLRDMDARIQEIEEEIECLFKRLIKTRVSLLNMHSH